MLFIPTLLSRISYVYLEFTERYIKLTKIQFFFVNFPNSI